MEVLLLYPNLSFTKKLWVDLDYYLNHKKNLSKQHKASENNSSVTDVKNKKEKSFFTF